MEQGGFEVSFFFLKQEYRHKEINTTASNEPAKIPPTITSLVLSNFLLVWAGTFVEVDRLACELEVGEGGLEGIVNGEGCALPGGEFSGGEFSGGVKLTGGRLLAGEGDC